MPFLLDTNHAAELLKSSQTSLWERMRMFGPRDCVLCMPVVSSDAHFAVVPGLQLDDWLKGL